MDVYTPINTILVRYRNRAAVTSSDIAAAQQQNNGNAQDQGIDQIQENRNYHQLDRLVVQTVTTERLSNTAEVISRMLKRKHYDVVDFEVTIPELLLKQQQQTKKIFNIVLGALAGISLLVGGIGIMNIMLASVMERIKEIGLRMAVGAKSTDIITQFLFEAMLISIVGGIIGIVLGMVIANIVARIADIPTIITLSSVLLSFGVAAAVGLIFGITPARKAASQNPINSLRYE
jgi:putative ABC transport system permease protein